MSVSIADALASAGELKSDSSRLDIELLLAHALGKRREFLLAHPEENIPEHVFAEFQQLLERRRQGEPIAYILGVKGFWDFDLRVTPAVLIPRPETELIVEQVLELYKGREGDSLTVADLGTGSGALAIALARCNPDWQVLATDISEQALVVARDNACKLDVERIVFRKGRWCEPLLDESCDLIVANPPYVRAGDKHLERDGLPFEPLSALVAEEEGLADLREIIVSAPRCLKRDSWLLLEHGFEQATAVADLMRGAGYVDIHCQRDYAGIDRMTRGRWPHTRKMH